MQELKRHDVGLFLKHKVRKSKIAKSIGVISQIIRNIRIVTRELLTEIQKEGLIPQGDHFYPDGWVFYHNKGRIFKANTTQ